MPESSIVVTGSDYAFQEGEMVTLGFWQDHKKRRVIVTRATANTFEFRDPHWWEYPKWAILPLWTKVKRFYWCTTWAIADQWPFGKRGQEKS